MNSPASIVISRPQSHLGLTQSSRVQRSRDTPRIKTPTNPSENFQFQISQVFQYISDSISQSRDDTHIAVTALSANAQKAYHELQLVESQLSRGEEIVGNKLTEPKQSLERF